MEDYARRDTIWTKKKATYTFLKDSEFEKRDSVYLDIDRIINEGMAGGNVYSSGGFKILKKHMIFLMNPLQM